MKNKLFLLAALMVTLATVTPLKAQTPNATLPYSTGFETGDDCAWDLLGGTNTNKWCIDTAAPCNGSHSLYVSNDDGVTNAYTVSAASVSYAVRTFTFASAANPYVISFDWRGIGESLYDYMRCFLVPASTTLTPGASVPEGMGSTATPAGWIDLGGKMNLSGGQWVNTTVQFSITTPGDYKVVFVWRNDESVGDQPAAAVDNVTLSEITCPLPVLTLASLTESEIVVTVSSSAPLLQVSLDGVNWVSTTDTIVDIDTLTPQTSYSLRVRAVCGPDDISVASVLNFTTPCEPIADEELPYVYGFEDATAHGSGGIISSCWGRYVMDPWDAYSPPYPYTYYKHSGTYSLYHFASNGGGAIPWSVMPRFASPVNNLQLSFWLYKYFTYGLVAVGVMTDPDDLSTFDTVAVVQPSATQVWELFEIPLSGYAGNGTYIAFMPVGSNSSSNIICIDDITVDLLPPCPQPTNIAMVASTASSVDLTWVNNAPWANGYGVEYGPHGFEQGTGTTVAATDTAVTLTGLMMGTSYDVYLTAICGGDTSTASFASFTVGCGTITDEMLPFAEDFETLGSGSSYPINACWTKGTNSPVAWPYPSSSAAISGSRGLFFYGYTSGTTSSYSWAAMPPVDESLALSSMMVRFDAKRYSSTASAIRSIIYVGIADSLTAFSTETGLESSVVWMDTVDLSLEVANYTTEVEVSFDQYDGNGSYVVFYAPGPKVTGLTDVFNYIYVDDVVLVALPSCHRPVEVTVTGVGAEEATLAWTPDPRTTSPDGWTVEYGPHGFTPGEGQTLTATDNTLTLDGLTPNTWYDVYVGAECGGEYSDTRSVNFVTGTEAAELPYTTGFEVGQDSDWVFYNAGQTNYWMIGEETTASGSRALFITNNGTDYAYTYASAPSSAFAFRTLDLAEATDYVVSFDWKAYGESSWDYLRAFLVPDSIAIIPGEMNGITSSATPDGWINVGEYGTGVKLNLSLDWQSNSVVVTIPEEGVGPYKLLFFWRNDASGGIQPPAMVDNVSVQRLSVSCLAPTDLTVVDTAVRSATLTWTADGIGFELLLDTMPVNPDSVDTPVLYSVVSDTVTLGDLMPNTTYYWYVRSICADSVVSDWSVEGSFTTLPLPTYTLTVLSNDETMGTVSGGGIYEEGSEVILTAIPNDGYHFDYWSTGDTTSTITVTVLSDTTVTATFARDSIPVVPDTVWRTVTVTTNATDVAEPYGSGVYADSSIVEIGYMMRDIATQGGDWQFLGWSDGPTDNPRSIVVTSDTVIVALFQWVADTTEGIDEISIFNFQFSIFPNPSHGDVTVKVGQPSELMVLDMQGRTVVPATPVNSTLLIPHSSLPAGTYFLRITTPTTTSTQKIIIQ